jgi:predicted AAA+ superfamily ATPase
MYIHREIDNELINWKNSVTRKPLLLRGARQVGKSSAIRNLGKSFTHFIEINFDEKKQWTNLFESTQNLDELLEQISIAENTPIIENETLLFLDEIQTSLPAINLLRYFYERKPNLHVIAAGSLLEFALKDLPSFGVGRIRSLFMYPISFNEFLLAHNEERLLEKTKEASPTLPLPELLHQKLISYYKKFLIIGGMPEAVKSYVINKDLLEVQRILDDLIISLQADFTKYKKRIEPLKISEVFSNVVLQQGEKFTYTYPNATLNNQQIKEILQLLEMAGLVHFVTHTAANGIPLGAEINPKKRKIILFDTGIYQRILKLDISQLLTLDNLTVINKGNIAELSVGLEIIKNQSPYEKTNLYYWQRDSKNSQAEVDYVIQKGEEILPIEVKAGTKGAMQSMFIFLKEKNNKKGIRISLENFGTMDKIEIYPLYGVWSILHRSKQKLI